MMLPSLGKNDAIARQRIAGLNGVVEVAASSANFSQRFNGMNAPVWTNSKNESVGLNYYYADEKFTPVLKFGFVAGRNFPVTADDEKERYMLLNEKAAHAVGFTESSKALGQKLWVNDSTQLEIIGVLKDFNYEGTGRPIQPLAFRSNKDACSFLYVQTESVDKKAMEERLKKALAGLPVTQPIAVSWLDAELDRGNSQAATISLLGFLGFIALSIATLGLLGLVIYTVEVKGKEISIRKIIGADEKELVRILSKGFVKLLVIAGLIAMPIGWILGTMFLQNFSIRINFGFINVLMCFLFLLGIGLFTIVSQTYKAAITNPVKALRTE